MTAIEQQPAPADSQPLQPQPGRDGLIFTLVNFRFLLPFFTLARRVAQPRELPRVERAGRADARSTGFSRVGPTSNLQSLGWAQLYVMGILSSISLVFILPRQVLCGPYYVLTLFHGTPVPIWVLIWVVCGKASC